MTTPIRVGLIGAGIGRSRTPLLHMAEAAAQGFRLRYDLIDIETQTGDKPSLERLIAEAEARGFAGLNITHPFKQAVLPLLAERAVRRCCGAWCGQHRGVRGERENRPQYRLVGIS